MQCISGMIVAWINEGEVDDATSDHAFLEHVA